MAPKSTRYQRSPWELIAIALGGIIVAVVAAWIPGRWAARTNVVEVLHAE